MKTIFLVFMGFLSTDHVLARQTKFQSALEIIFRFGCITSTKKNSNKFWIIWDFQNFWKTHENIFVRQKILYFQTRHTIFWKVFTDFFRFCMKRVIRLKKWIFFLRSLSAVTPSVGGLITCWFKNRGFSGAVGAICFSEFSQKSGWLSSLVSHIESLVSRKTRDNIP